MALKKYKPIVIAITGSVGKTSTKEAIFTVLKNHFGEERVRKNEKNYNNEIGVPLTIFNLKTGGNSILRWIPKFIKMFYVLLFRVDYPDFLVLEMYLRPKELHLLVVGETKIWIAAPSPTCILARALVIEDNGSVGKSL